MEKKKKYYDLLGAKEEKNTYIGLANLGLLVVCLIEFAIIVRLATTPKPIYYIPSANKPGIAYPNHIPEEAIEFLSLSYVLTRANFTPATIQDVLAVTYKYLTPKKRAEDEAKEKYIIESVKRTSLSQTFSLTSEPVLEETEDGYIVEIDGVEQRYTGQSLASTKNIRYRVLTKKIVPTDINKYGLGIDAVEREGDK